MTAPGFPFIFLILAMLLMPLFAARRSESEGKVGHFPAPVLGLVAAAIVALIGVATYFFVTLHR